MIAGGTGAERASSSTPSTPARPPRGRPQELTRAENGDHGLGARLPQPARDRDVAAEQRRDSAGEPRDDGREQLGQQRGGFPRASGAEFASIRRDVEDVGRDPVAQSSGAQPRKERDERPQAEPEHDTEGDGRRESRAHANHLRSSGSRPIATIAR